MNWIFGRLFGFFIGRFFRRLDRRFKSEGAAFEKAQAALGLGDEAPLEREWQRVSTREHGRDRVQDNHELRVALLWGEHLQKQEKWPEAQSVFERALGASLGVATQRIEVLFYLAETLLCQNKGEQAQSLLRDHPLVAQIEAISRSFPGSDTGARLAHLRLDFAGEARLRRLAFEPSPLLPGELSQTLRAATGSDGERWRKIAYAHYNAGEISLAVQAQERAIEGATNALQEAGGRCLLALWRRAREGWDAVEPLLGEAQTLASGSLAAEGMVLGIGRLRAQERGDWAEWQRVQEQLRLRGAGDMTTENSDADTAILRGDFVLARRAIKRMRAAPLPPDALEAFRARAFPVLTRAFLELRARYCGEIDELAACEPELRAARNRLQGDARLFALCDATLALCLAALKREAQALEIAASLESGWNNWSDDVSTQTALASMLGSVYFGCARFESAIVWLERAQELEFRPAYRTSSRETLARAYFQSGDEARARQLRREIVESGLEIKAVELARKALEQ